MSPLPDSLLRAPLFAGVPLGAVEIFIASCSHRELSKGEYLLRAGRTNTHLFIVGTGSVGVQITSETAGGSIRSLPSSWQRRIAPAPRSRC